MSTPIFFQLDQDLVLRCLSFSFHLAGQTSPDVSARIGQHGILSINPLASRPIPSALISNPFEQRHQDDNKSNCQKATFHPVHQKNTRDRVRSGQQP